MKNKIFRRKEEYYFRLLVFTLALLMSLWMLSWLIGLSETEIYEIFGEQISSGNSSHRGVQGIEMLLTKNLGGKGILLIPNIAIVCFFYSIRKEIFEFRRFLKKDKLFKQGLVDNLDDDYEPTSILKMISNIFKKSDKRRNKYPSKKEIKEKIENIDYDKF